MLDPSAGTHLLRGVLVLSLAAPVAAQGPFAELTTRALDPATGSPGVSAAADVDGDGDLDLLIPSVVGQDRLYLNDGDAVFRDVTAGSLPVAAGWSHSATFVDVDNDGDVDLLVAGNSGLAIRGEQNRLLLNDGTGVFTDVTARQLPVDQDKTVRIVPIDADADGDQDLLCVNSGVASSIVAQNRLYANDGFGTFTDVTATALPADPGYGRGAEVGDFDGDGDLDFVTAVFLEERPLRLYLNDGSGRFTGLPAGRMPALPSSAHVVHAPDVDGDGDLDLVSLAGGQLRVLINDGRARFTDESAVRVPAGYGFPHLSGDFDLDGDVDFTLSTASSGGLLVNDGRGFFQLVVGPLGGGQLAVDLDGDRDLDVVLSGGSDVLLNDGRGNFFDRLDAERRGPGFVGRPEGAAVADVDGDGDLDALLTGSLLDSTQLLLNDGRGVFGQSGASLPPLTERRSDVALGDVDGDGDVDALLSSSTGSVRTVLWLGDGVGGFRDVTAARMPGSSGQTTALELADVDGDGDLDLVEGNYWNASRLSLNDGSGRFTLAPRGTFPVDQDSTRAVAAVDVDGDRDLDLVFANYGQPPRLYLNDGIGRFTDVSAARLPATASYAWDVAAADVDGDGDVDLVVVSEGRVSSLYLNDGTGTFTDGTAGRLPADFGGFRVHAVDRDLDGDLDLVVGDGNAVQTFVNDGQGRFALQAELGVRAFPVAVADFDGDVDGDALLAGENHGVGVATNLRRQIHFGRVVRIGRAAAVDVYAVGRRPGSDLALPFLAAGAARIQVPGLGLLGLDPQSVVPGQAVTLVRGQDVARWTFPVPASPSLVGTFVYGQAIVAEGGLLALTNAQRVEIVH